MTTAIMPNIKPTTVPAMDLRPHRRPLDAIFAPRAVAVVGATENSGSVGNAIMRNLTDGRFTGEVYPVNPKRAQVFGRRAFPSVRAIGRPVDLAVIATPAPTV